MADKSKIEWTEATWNPVTGCTKVSAGCKHCYAEREWPRLTKLVPAYAGRAFSEVRPHPERLVQPLHWKKPRRIFVNSMSDLFHEDVTDEIIDQVFGVMWACLYGRNEQPGHVFQVLTKRTKRMRDYFSTDRREAWARSAVNHGGGIDPDGLFDQTISFDGPHPRIWLGVSVEDQAAADERIPLLLDTPAAVRWVSAEPLLGPVNAGIYLSRTHMPGLSMMPGFVDSLPGIDWVVVGGESGPNARPMSPDWARSVRDQCATAGVPFLFKQWGEWIPMLGQAEGISVKKKTVTPDGWVMGWSGKKAAGRLLDGVQHDGYPEAPR